MLIDTTFDFRADAGGRDPDQHSPTLRRYHQLLWSKALPSGHRFDLDTTTPGEYLHHSSALGEFWLGSDAVMATFSNWEATTSVIAQIPPADVEYFGTLMYTIGGMVIFPNHRVAGKMTLNGARGFNNRRIADRMDLTLECIRRYYRGDTQTPLGAVVARYRDFFDLFGDFRGYVDHFLLQDLVTADYGVVEFFVPFEGFEHSAVPDDLATYLGFRDRAVEFVHARNKRIQAWASEHLDA